MTTDEFEVWLRTFLASFDQDGHDIATAAGDATAAVRFYRAAKKELHAEDQK